MNTEWHKVIYPPSEKNVAGLVMAVSAIYRKLDDKTDFCVFSSDAPATAYFSPKAAELCSAVLRSLAGSEGIEVGPCDKPFSDKLLRLELGRDPDCHSLLYLSSDAPEAM